MKMITSMRIIFIMFQLKCLSLAERNVCQERSQCIIYYEFMIVPKEHFVVSWYRHNTMVSTCSTEGKCDINPDYKDWVVGQCTSKRNSTIFTLKLLPSIFNTVKNTSGEWELRAYNTKSVKIFVQSYAFSEQIECNFETSYNTLSLNCHIYKAYPLPRCNFYETLTAKDYTQRVLYSHSQIEEPYFTTTCSIQLNVTEKVETRFNFMINLYPNISNTKRDEKYGSVVNKSICIDMPVVKFNCPSDVREGYDVRCACEKQDTCNENVTVVVELNGEKINSGKSSAVIFTRAVKRMDFSCYGINDVHWESECVKYCPTFIKRLGDFRCPESQHTCGEHGYCYNPTEFCNFTTKLVESCFPLEILPENLKEWCFSKGMHNVSLMRALSCNTACITKFGKGPIKSDSNTWQIVTAATVPSVVLIIMVTMIACCFWRYRKKHQTTLTRTSKRMADNARIHQDLTEVLVPDVQVTEF